MFGFAPGSGSFHRVETRDDALDIAVDRRRGPVERDGRDRRRRIGADPGEGAQCLLACRK